MLGKSTYLNALKDGLPNIVTDDDMAEEVIDIVFSVPVKALENGDSIELPNLGSINIDKSKGKDCLSYQPESALIQCVFKGSK